MGVLDEITQMQSQGQDNETIAKALQEKGVSPKEISDAMNQAKIKSAVSDEQAYEPPTPTGQIPTIQTEGDYTPQTQERTQEETQEQQAYSPPAYQEPPQGEQYQQGDYDDYSQGGFDTDTMVEISEQVFQEKITQIQKQVENFSEFKNLIQSTVDNLSERLARIEKTIDKLHLSILDKVGSYGRNLEHIKKEMGMMQTSFGKMEHKAPVHPTPVHKPTTHTTTHKLPETTTNHTPIKKVHKKTTTKK